tara:strand:- start:13403 stop:13879 length:477 start_codon:yes stop_codon:yes gene_type:complete
MKYQKKNQNIPEENNMKTAQDIIIKDYNPHSMSFGGYGKIIIPKGTRLTHQTALGLDKNYHFVDDLSWIKKDYPQFANILLHDFRYHNYNVKKEFVDFGTPAEKEIVVKLEKSEVIHIQLKRGCSFVKYKNHTEQFTTGWLKKMSVNDLTELMKTKTK